MLQDRFVECNNCGKSSNYPKSEVYVDGVTCKYCDMPIDASRLIIQDTVVSLLGEDSMYEQFHLAISETA